MTLLNWLAGWTALAAVMLTGPASAQIGPLPGGQTLPGLPGVSDRLPALGDIDGLARQTLDRAGQAPSRLGLLVRRSEGALERDPLGWPVVAGEIVTMDLSGRALERALAAGFTIVREERLEALELTSTVLAPPPRMPLARAVAHLRRLDPEAGIAFNHVHAPAGAVAGLATGGLAASAPPATGVRLGLIDTGVEADHPALSGSRVTQRGFAGPARAGAHGLAVASLMVGRSGSFSGGAPGADLLVADIYGGQPAGGSSTALAGALAWMVEQRVAVVNVSLVGPRNDLVQRAIARAVSRGVVVVAAVGNDGPAAPPLYPASYQGVVGVSAVNSRNQVLPEAARGAQVDFTAPGADMAAAARGGGWVAVRGTSFAAPVVAGLLARRGAAGLAREAVDLGARGPDPAYGRGLVGVASRVPPREMGARGRLGR